MRLKFEEIQAVLKKVLLARQCQAELAEKVAYEMARNSLEGTYTHGVNRFARLIESIDEGIVRVDGTPVMKNKSAAIENYDGQLGLGVTNALFSMDRAISLAREYGIGLIALSNTNHWMRAATYGYQACQAGMVGICFTNTIPNMPTWGAEEARLGNNPLMVAFPRIKGDVVVDMAMTQFSYGALELAKLEGRKMPVDAGFDTDGELTKDPAEVLESRRILPTGFWKGAALSFVLDIIAAAFSQGNSTLKIGQLPGGEQGVSQVFIAIDFSQMTSAEVVEEMADMAVHDLLASKPSGDERIVYPGQRLAEIREENLKKGIPVNELVWQEILELLNE